MERCSKYQGCSAPICPLDKDFKSRVKLTEDEKCTFLGKKSLKWRKTMNKRGVNVNIFDNKVILPK